MPDEDFERRVGALERWALALDARWRDLPATMRSMQGQAAAMIRRLDALAGHRDPRRRGAVAGRPAPVGEAAVIIDVVVEDGGTLLLGK